MLFDLPDEIPPDHTIGSVTADRAYDTRKCEEAIVARNAVLNGYTALGIPVTEAAG